MTIATKEIQIKNTVKQVWNTVTDLKNYEWRSDISRIDIVNEKTFVEYSNENIATRFTITAFEVGKRYAFTIENSNMRGKWEGTFKKDGEYVLFTCTEDVEAKRFFMKPFIKKFLKLQQERYAMDLLQALEQ